MIGISCSERNLLKQILCLLKLPTMDYFYDTI